MDKSDSCGPGFESQSLSWQSQRKGRSYPKAIWGTGDAPGVSMILPATQRCLKSEQDTCRQIYSH